MTAFEKCRVGLSAWRDKAGSVYVLEPAVILRVGLSAWRDKAGSVYVRGYLAVRVYPPGGLKQDPSMC